MSVNNAEKSMSNYEEGQAFEQQPIVVLPNGGESLVIGGGEFIHKVKSGDTNNVFSVIEIITPPGQGVSSHVHEKEDELVYLLQGEIEVTLGDQTMKAVPGVMALLPRGIPHSFVNVGDTHSIIIDTILPGAFDNYFVEMAALYESGEPTQEEVDALSVKYSIKYL